jgi:phage FluMu protein Com
VSQPKHATTRTALRHREIRCSCSKKLADLVVCSGRTVLEFGCPRCKNRVEVTIDAESVTIRDLKAVPERPVVGTIHLRN